MTLRVLLAILVALLAAPWASAAEKTTTVAIEEIARPPFRYDGQTLEVRGVLNECVRFSCLLCPARAGELPKPGKDLSCLRVEFETGADKGQADELAEQLYRFAEITAVGRYDATCDRHREDIDKAVKAGQALVETIFCTDRATDFYIANVVQVHKRWPATSGFMTLYAGARLREANAADSARVIAAFNGAQTEEGWTLDPKDALKVFRVERTADKPKADEAYLCQCLDASCDGRWPTLTGHLIASALRPYRCARAEQVKGKWAFPPRLE